MKPSLLELAMQRVTHIGEFVDGHPIAEKRTYSLQLRFQTKDEMRAAAAALRASNTNKEQEQ